jgi:hypothetical protein
MMKLSSMALAVGLLFVAGVVLAQDTTSNGKSKSDVRTITGCLAQGSSADKFVLNGSDGSTWDVKSDTVSLSDRVGHTISAKGTVSNVTMHNMKEEAKDAASPAGMKKSNNEHGDLAVDSMKMVSKSCK